MRLAQFRLSMTRMTNERQMVYKFLQTIFLQRSVKRFLVTKVIQLEFQTSVTEEKSIEGQSINLSGANERSDNPHYHAD
jgi:hypothetical protein